MVGCKQQAPIVEFRRLRWLIALAFSVVLLVQYSELPCEYVLSNLVSFAKFQEPLADSGLDLAVANSTGVHDGSEILDIEEEFSDGKQDFKSDVAKNSKDRFIGSDYSGDESPHSELSGLSSSDSTDETVEGEKILTPEKSRENGTDLRLGSTSNSSSDNLKSITAVPASNIAEEEIVNTTTSQISSKTNSYSFAKDGRNKLPKDGRRRVRKSKLSASGNHSFVSTSTRKRFKRPPAVVVPISAMNTMLLQSRFSHMFVKPKWPSPADQELLDAKTLIGKAEMMEQDPDLDGSLFRNLSVFLRSYELMERTLRIYVYAEGEKPVFHGTELTGIYASEGWFMKQLEESKQFVTKDPNKTNLFYLPFSSRLLEETLYVPNSHSRKNLVQFLSSYLRTITTRYNFWNRTGGADHFLVACHDWAPAETSRIMKNCIRSLCNADAKGGFLFGKDVSLPETFVHSSVNPLENHGGKPPSERKILAFFAGKVHGYFRPILVNHWENRDPDMKIFGTLPDEKGQMNYTEYMKSSKYCISAKGYEGNTPRVVEAILYECVPVIISDNYVAPFFETMNWESFAVFVLEKDVPNLKNILMSIPETKYLEMQQRVKRAQKHFLWHQTPEKFDVFHMILHSIWYTRISQLRP